MRKTTLMALTAFAALFASTSTVAQVEKSTSLFSCVDKETLELNSTCIASTISNKPVFKQTQQSLLLEADLNSDYAVATISLDPKTLNIEIVTQRDGLSTAQAAVTNPVQ